MKKPIIALAAVGMMTLGCLWRSGGSGDGDEDTADDPTRGGRQRGAFKNPDAKGPVEIEGAPPRVAPSRS